MLNEKKIGEYLFDQCHQWSFHNYFAPLELTFSFFLYSYNYFATLSLFRDAGSPLFFKRGVGGEFRKSNNEVIFPDQVRINLKYLEKQSLWLDLRIIVYTLLGKKPEEGMK